MNQMSMINHAFGIVRIDHVLSLRNMIVKYFFLVFVELMWDGALTLYTLDFFFKKCLYFIDPNGSKAPPHRIKQACINFFSKNENIEKISNKHGAKHFHSYSPTGPSYSYRHIGPSSHSLQSIAISILGEAKIERQKLSNLLKGNIIICWERTCWKAAFGCSYTNS